MLACFYLSLFIIGGVSDGVAGPLGSLGDTLEGLQGGESIVSVPGCIDTGRQGGIALRQQLGGRMGP
jgi:hypothetical protein